MDAFTRFMPALTAVQHDAYNRAGMVAFMSMDLNRCNWCGCPCEAKFTVNHLGDIFLVCRDCLLSVGWHVVYLTPNYCREFSTGYNEDFSDFDSF